MLFGRNRTLLTCCWLPSLRYEQIRASRTRDPTVNAIHNSCVHVYSGYKSPHTHTIKWDAVCVCDLCVSVGKSHFAPFSERYGKIRLNNTGHGVHVFVCVRISFTGIPHRVWVSVCVLLDCFYLFEKSTVFMHLSRLFQLDGYTLTREKFLNSSVFVHNLTEIKVVPIKPLQNIWINDTAFVGQRTQHSNPPEKKCADFKWIFQLILNVKWVKNSESFCASINYAVIEWKFHDRSAS